LYILSNLTKGIGDTKAVPHVSMDVMRKMASVSSEAAAALENIIDAMLTVPPYTLGYPSETAQSSYYFGDKAITKEEVLALAKVMERHNIWPDNTRVHTTVEGDTPVFEILQATTQPSDPFPLESDFPGARFRVKPGDHAAELSRVCSELRAAAEYALNDIQTALMHQYITYFQTGNVQAFLEAQKTWVADISPRVEHIIGFMESYRDPSGVRCEWESMTAISDPKQTAKLDGLVQNATKFIRLLPWAVPGVNNGKGPFEPTHFDAPDFTIVHGL
jgi:dipeptidyl-peptidase-3